MANRLTTALGGVYSLLHPRAPVAPLDVDDFDQVSAPGNPPGLIVTPFHAARNTQTSAASDELNLSLTIFSAFNIGVIMTGLVKFPNGGVAPIGPNGQGYTFGIVGDRVARTANFLLGNGAELVSLDLVSVPPAGFVPPQDKQLGSTWAIVSRLVTTSQQSFTAVQTILSGPLSPTQPLTIGSSIRTSLEGPGYMQRLFFPVPAAGADVLFNVPAGVRWQILGIHLAVFATSGVGVNRFTELYINQLAINTFQSSVPGPIPVNSFYEIFYAPGQQWQQYPYVTGGVTTVRQYAPLPPDVFVFEGDGIQTQTFNIQAGDQWGNVLTMQAREWLNP